VLVSFKNMWGALYTMYTALFTIYRPLISICTPLFSKLTCTCGCTLALGRHATEMLRKCVGLFLQYISLFSQYIGLFSQYVGLFSQNKPASAACTVALGSHATDTKTRSIGVKGCPPVTRGCETLRCHNYVKRDLYTYKETSKRDLDMKKRHMDRGGGKETYDKRAL